MATTQCITFEAFMRKALYDPSRGYYARNIRAVGGSRGDFTTVPMQCGSVLARAIANWAVGAMRRTGCRHLVETGPGEGVLMGEVLRHLPWTTRLRTRVHLVENSPVLAKRQQALLGRRATWHADPASAIRACGGRAVVFSNELVDAFPVRVFRKSAADWHELAVETDSAGRVVRERWIDVDARPDSSVFGVDHPEGQRVEVHDAYRAWLADWLPLWRAGEMLTIDYGDGVDALYHRRPGGTLRGYLMHQRVTGPEIYRNIGMQDLTADVNFTDLARWAGPWCESQAPQTLAKFLRQTPGRGIHGDLDDAHRAGGAFQVIRQKPRDQGKKKFFAKSAGM